MSSPRFVKVALASLGLVGAIACAPTHRMDAGPRRSGTGDRITPDELARVQGPSAAEAVLELRPEFLRPSATPAHLATGTATPSVYVNDRYDGGLETLRTIPVAAVEEIRYVRAVSARTMFGSFCPCDGGVILVRTRRAE